MNTLEQIRDSIGKAWDNLSEGWRELWDRAGQALTRFHPFAKDSERSSEGQIAKRSARWGLLAAEVSVGDKDVKVELEIPGMTPQDLDIEVLNNALVVRGEKHVSREEERGEYYVTERAYGRFQRSIPLPAEVDDAGAKAVYRHGVLEVTLPKTSRAGRSKKIYVNGE